MERKLVIIGAGGLAREIFHVSQDTAIGSERDRWKPMAFVVDSEFKTLPQVEGIPVVEFDKIDNIVESDTSFIIAVGDPGLRQRMCDKLFFMVPNVKYGSVIHKSAVILPKTVIEEGVYIAPNVTITTDCFIGKHVVITQNTSIGHDCNIASFSVVCPGCVLSGWTSVGKGSFLGSSVILYPKVKVGENCVVSAGAVVARNLRDGHKQILKPNTMTLPA